MAYSRDDIYDPKVTEEIAGHVREILRLIGEDPGREGLDKTVGAGALKSEGSSIGS